MSSKPAPTQDEIATRALEIAKRRGGGHGEELEDWSQAERELRLERGLPVSHPDENARRNSPP